MNKPHAFQEKIAAILNYVLENKKNFYIGIGVAAGIIIIAVGWYFYRLDYEKNAQKLYASAFNAYHFAITKPGDEESVMRTIGMYQEVVKKYPGSRAAAYSFLGLGNLYFKIRDYDRSIQAYQDYLNSSGATKDLKALAFSGLGYCYEVKGQREKAIEAYENSARDSIGGAFTGVTYINIARIHEQMKNFPKALEYYKKASEQKNEALLEALIKRKIAELDS